MAFATHIGKDDMRGLVASDDQLVIACKGDVIRPEVGMNRI